MNVFGIAGHSGMGKTTLLERLVPELTSRGLIVSLDYLLSRLQRCDQVLVEGFKQGDLPKLEVWRPSLGRTMLWPKWPGIAGIASDAPRPSGSEAPPAWLDLHDIGAIADFVLSRPEPPSA